LKSRRVEGACRLEGAEDGLMAVNVKKVAIFAGLAYGLSYLLATLYFALGGTETMPGMLALGVAYMFVPLTAAVMVQKLIYQAPLREPLRIRFRPNRWFLVAWLLPPLIALATLGVSLLFPGVTFSPEMAGMFERFRGVLPPEQIEAMQRQADALPIHPFWLGLLLGLVAGITINAVAAFGEEAGWRGLLLTELAPWGFWRSSVVIGVLWGFWHAPLILQGHNYPEHPRVGVFLMTVMTVLLSPLLGYITLKAHSVIAAAIFHGTLNATAGLAILVVEGGSDLTVGVSGLAGFLVLALADAGLFVYDRRWGGHATVTGPPSQEQRFGGP
jgi:membrane protease YdiL (CAAX protease family)